MLHVTLQDCTLFLAWQTVQRTGGKYAYIEMYHSADKAHEGWVAVGFSDDRKMGNDAVIMDVTGGIYMSKYEPGDLLTRWNVDTPDEGKVQPQPLTEEGKRTVLR